MNIDYDRCSFESTLAQEKYDCAVVAIAITTQTDYSAVRSALRKHGREDCTPTEHGQIIAAVRELGYTVVHPHTDDEILPTCYNEHCRLTIDSPTGRKYWTFRSITSILKHNRKYMISSSEHIAAVVNGKIEDWSTGRLFRVVAVWEIKRATN